MGRVPIAGLHCARDVRTRRMVGLVRVARAVERHSEPGCAPTGGPSGWRSWALVFAAVRPAGLERYAVEITSAGSGRAVLYVGHRVLLAPNQAMWILSPAMGGCVAVRVEGRSRDVLCLDRIRAADPATWMLSEIGRVRGRRGRAHALGRPGLPARAGGGDRRRVRGSAAWPGRQPARLRSAPEPARSSPPS